MYAFRGGQVDQLDVQSVKVKLILSEKNPAS